MDLHTFDPAELAGRRCAPARSTCGPRPRSSPRRSSAGRCAPSRPRSTRSGWAGAGRCSPTARGSGCPRSTADSRCQAPVGEHRPAPAQLLARDRGLERAHRPAEERRRQLLGRRAHVDRTRAARRARQLAPGRTCAGRRPPPAPRPGTTRRAPPAAGASRSRSRGRCGEPRGRPPGQPARAGGRSSRRRASARPRRRTARPA